MTSPTMDETLVIVLPLPPRVLSPNCPGGTRGGRFARASAARAYKDLARRAAEESGVTGWQGAEVEARFFHKTARRRDDVNHLAMLKPAYDGIVLAGLLPDDDRAHLRTTGAAFAVDRAAPRVELHFTRCAPASMPEEKEVR